MLQSQNLRVGQVKEPYIRVNIRQLNEVLATKLFALYMLEYLSVLHYQQPTLKAICITYC